MKTSLTSFVIALVFGISLPSGQSFLPRGGEEDISNDDDLHICSSSSSDLFDEALYTFPQAIENASIAAGLPPQMKHIFGTFLGFQAFIPGIKMYETPLIVRFTHLIDRLGWNCMASHSPVWKDYLTNGGEPLVRTPQKVRLTGDDDVVIDIDMHNSDMRFLCMVHGWSAVVQDWIPESASDVFNYMNLYEVTTGGGYNDEVTIASCFDNDGKADSACLQSVAESHCYNPSIMGANVAQQLKEFARTDGWNSEGVFWADLFYQQVLVDGYSGPGNMLKISILTPIRNAPITAS